MQQKAICGKRKIKRTVGTVNEKPYLRTRIWIGVSVSQQEPAQLYKNYCPCVGKTKDSVFVHDKKKVVFSQESLQNQQEN